MQPQRPSQQRQLPRIAALVTTAGVSVVANVRELSLGHLTLEETMQLQDGVPCTVALRRLPDIDQEWISAIGVIECREEERLGIRLESLADRESYSAFRNLMLDMSNAPHATAAEFALHWGPRDAR